MWMTAIESSDSVESLDATDGKVVLCERGFPHDHEYGLTVRSAVPVGKSGPRTGPCGVSRFPPEATLQLAGN
jgi:hypothetical protein